MTAEPPRPVGAPALSVRFHTRPGADGFGVAEVAARGTVDDAADCLAWLVRHLEESAPRPLTRPVAAVVDAAAAARADYADRAGWLVDGAPFVAVNPAALDTYRPDEWAASFAHAATRAQLPADVTAAPVAPLSLVPMYAPAMNPDVVPAGIPAAALDAMTAEVGARWNADSVGRATSDTMRELCDLWREVLTREGYAPVAEVPAPAAAEVPALELPASVLETWAAAWPASITLGEAAEEMTFDLWSDDDPATVLVRSFVDVADVAGYSIAELADNDADDRFTPLELGLLAGGADVPPVVVLPGEGLRDGAHRVALAEAAGLSKVPAYVVPAAG